MATELITEPVKQAPPFHSRRFTLEEYRQIRDSGVLDDGPRFEFLDGWIVTKMTQGTKHAAIVQVIQEWLARHLPSEWKVRVQSAVEAAGNEPEPDIAVVRGPATRYLEHHPVGDEIALLIEVAETSLAKDRHKTQIYAQAGVPHCWIVNLQDRQVEVFRNPLPDDLGYQDQHIARAGESLDLSIEGVPTLTMAVSDVIPDVH